MGAAFVSEPDRAGTHALVEQEAGNGTSECQVIGIRQISVTLAIILASEDQARARGDGMSCRGWVEGIVGAAAGWVE